MYFLFHGLKYFHFRRFCKDNGVNYSSALYCLKSNYSINKKYDLHKLLFDQPELLDVLIERYSIKKKGNK